MTKEQAKEAVRRYVAKAWPCSSLTRDGCWRAAWAQSHLAIGLIDFMSLVAAEGFRPRRFGGDGGPWILRFPGREPARLADGAITCEGAQ